MQISEWKNNDRYQPTQEEIDLMDAAHHEWKATLDKAVADGDEELAAELWEMGK